MKFLLLWRTLRKHCSSAVTSEGETKTTRKRRRSCSGCITAFLGEKYYIDLLPFLDIGCYDFGRVYRPAIMPLTSVQREADEERLGLKKYRSRIAQDSSPSRRFGPIRRDRPRAARAAYWR